MDSRLIHRYWDGEANPLHLWTGRVLSEIHPTAEILEWTPETLPVATQCLVQEVAPNDPVRASDLVRYHMLWQLGGLWVDNDVVALQDLTTSRSAWTSCLGPMREGCVLWFPTPGHPMLHAVIELERQSPPGMTDCLLTEAGKDYPSVRLEQRTLPFDNRGRLTTDKPPLAVHLWSSSSLRWISDDACG